MASAPIGSSNPSCCPRMPPIHKSSTFVESGRAGGETAKANGPRPVPARPLESRNAKRASCQRPVSERARPSSFRCNADTMGGAGTARRRPPAPAARRRRAAQAERRGGGDPPRLPVPHRSRPPIAVPSRRGAPPRRDAGGWRSLPFSARGAAAAAWRSQEQPGVSQTHG